MLQIARVNTDAEIQQYKEDEKLDRLVAKLNCRRCNHHWSATYWELFESPCCPKCGC